MTLTFQITADKESIELFFDQEGLDLLKKIINKNWHEPMKLDNKNYDFDHEHLMSKEWGGDELTPEFTSENCSRVHAIKIVYIGRDG